MTTTVISTAMQTAGTTLALAASQNLLITSAGSLISTGGIGLTVSATSTANNITIDGLVYGDTFGIETLAGGQNAHIQINGEVSSAGTAIALNAGHGSVTIGTHGLVDGTTTGIADNGGNNIVNDGTITSDSGVALTIGAIIGDQIVNNGTIDGIEAECVNLLLINYGDITDIGSAPQADSSVNTIRNFGRIGDIGLHNGDLLYNYADIAGSVSFVGNGFFKNSGTLHGDYNQDGVTGQQIVINKGDIYGDINLVVGNNSIDSSHGHVFGTMNGGLGNDTLLGGDNDDNIAGNGGEDLLKGGAGDDVLNGGSDKDRLFGGAGDDTLTGGSGRDTFIFSGNFGQDTVTDFTATGSSHDVIRFAHNDFADFADLSPHMTQAGVDVHITLDATDSIVIQNVTLANLTSGDFLFG